MSILPTTIPTTVWKGKWCQCGKRLTTPEGRRTSRCGPCDKAHRARYRRKTIRTTPTTSRHSTE